MNRRSPFLPLVGVTVLCLMLVFACSLNTETEPSEAEIEDAVAYADEMTAEATELLIEARATGVTVPIDAFAADLEVADIITPALERRVQPLVKPTPDDATPSAYDWVLENAEHGDILLFKGDGSAWTTELMQLVLVGDYFHAGVYVLVDADGTGPEPPQPYLVSASIRISGTNVESGVLVQTIEEVTEGSIRVAIIESGLGPGVNSALDATLTTLASLPPDATFYSFIYPNLDPVPRADDYLWYCSKVAWRAYAAAGINVEYREATESWTPSMEFYLIDDRWVAFKDTVIFELYREFLTRIFPRWPRLVERLTVAKLQKVLTELITPDEIYAWGVGSGYAMQVWGDALSVWSETE